MSISFKRSRSILISIAAPCLLFAALCACAADTTGNRTEKLDPSPAPKEARIKPSQVKRANLDRFESQVRRDLPVGTPKQDVEQYLSSEGFEYSFQNSGYATKEDPLLGNSCRSLLPNVGSSMLVFQVDLLIEIHIGPDEMVDAIRFSFDSPNTL